MEQQYLIWSVEHCAWWRSRQTGYTTSRMQAGRYTLEEARRICLDANLFVEGEGFITHDFVKPNECMVPV